MNEHTLGAWELLNNPEFKGIEFDAFKSEAGLNSFVMTPTKWIAATNAVGVRVKRGMGMDRPERAEILNRMAREQMAALLNNETLNRLLPAEGE